MKTPLLLFTAAVLALRTTQAQVSLPYYDGFNYTAGSNLAGNGGWLSASGSGTVKVNASNLTYPSLQSSVGNDVTVIASSSAARTYVNFTSQSSGSVHFSFLLRINALPSAQRLVGYASGSTSSSSSPPLGFFVTASGQLAVGIGTGSPQFTSSALTTGATYLIVVRYTFGTTTDTAEVWINPGSLGGSAPVPTANFGGSHNASLASFLWNTPSASSGGGSYEVDELRIGATYADVTPSTSPPAGSAGLRVTHLQAAGSNLTLTGKGGPSGGSFETLGTGDLMLPLSQWEVVGSDTFDGGGDFSATVSASGSGPRFFVVGVATSPSITTPPQSQPAATGQNVTLGVEASGGVHLNYQWSKNAQPIAGATSPTLSITNAEPADAGSYTVAVSNSLGSVTSTAAVLTVSDPQTDGDFYVSPTGNDSSPGTLDAPFRTVQKAIAVAAPGHKIYLRGGTYPNSQTITISKSGTAGAPIKLWAYPGEKPVLDFSTQPYGSANRGVLLTTNGNYWDFKGLEIMRAGDNGVKVEASHIRFEQCVFHHNGDTGLQIGFAHETNNPGANLAAFIEVINCDSYMNYDPDNRGSDADGFAAKLHCGQGIVFIGCRAWKNSDDGWDLFETDAAVVIRDCWTWHSGDGSLYPGTGSFQGNGNGFKLGGNGSGGSSKGTHQLINGVSFNNNFKSNAQGITNNSHQGGLIIQNCLSFSNGSSAYNYFMEGGGQPMILKNCVSFPRPGSATNVSLDSEVGNQNNSWSLSVSANASDYVDLSEAAAEAPRKADGSLPDGFARLVAGSDLIDKGVNAGAPFNGSAPDLGPYEFQP